MLVNSDNTSNTNSSSDSNSDPEERLSKGAPRPLGAPPGGPGGPTTDP